MVIMKEKVASKLKEVYKSLQAAKKYGVDVRMEDKKYADCNIAFSKNKYTDDIRFNLTSNELSKTLQDRFNSILKELTELERTILDKRKIYQVRETLTGMFDMMKNDKKIIMDEYINRVKAQLDIYKSCKIDSIYRPERVIDEIFSIVYDSIKMELKNNGVSTILDNISSDETSMTRLNNFLSRDIEMLGKILGSDDEMYIKIKDYRKDNGQKLLDEKLLSMVVDTTSSNQIEEKINNKTSEIKSQLEGEVEKAKEQREKYTAIAKLQSKTRKYVRDLKRSIDKKLMPILCSLVLMSGVGLGVYSISSNSSNNDIITVSETEIKDNTKQLKAITKSEDYKDETPLIIASVSALATAFIPKFGLAFQGVSYLKDRKKYNRTIEEIVERKREMEALRENIETIVTSNETYSKELNKQREIILWSSIYSGLTDEQSEILTEMEETLTFNRQIIETLDNIDEMSEDNEYGSRRLVS